MRNWISLIAGVAFVLALVGGWHLWRASSLEALEAAHAELAELGFAATFDEISAGGPSLGPPPAPEDNGGELYRRAIAAFVELRGAEDNGPSLSSWRRAETGLLDIPPEVSAALPALAPVLEGVARAAAKPRCRFDIDWAEGYRIESPHLRPLLALAHWLGARAIVRARDGDLDGALADVRVTFRTGDALREEPLLVSQMVRAAIAVVACESLREVLLGHPAPLVAFEAAAPHAAEGGIALALATEAVTILSLENRAEYRNIWLLGPHIDGSLACCASVTARLAALARRPYVDVREAMLELEAEGAAAVNSFTAAVRPFGEPAYREEARVASLVELTRIGARALARRRRLGRYPRSIGSLPGAPADPLTGSPFVLTPRADGGLDVSTSRAEGTGWEKTLWSLPAELP